MTPGQIERLREWHQQVYAESKHRVFDYEEYRAIQAGFTFYKKVTSEHLAIQEDLTKIYLNGELISEIKEEV